MDHLELNVQEYRCIYGHMMEEGEGGAVTADPQLLETDELLQILLMPAICVQCKQAVLWATNELMKPDFCLLIDFLTETFLHYV